MSKREQSAHPQPYSVPFTIQDLVREAERELELRKRVYPRWVEKGKLHKRKADLHLALQRAIIAKLKELL